MNTQEQGMLLPSPQHLGANHLQEAEKGTRTSSTTTVKSVAMQAAKGEGVPGLRGGLELLSRQRYGLLWSGSTRAVCCSGEPA
jgi:hypothetical protein